MRRTLDIRVRHGFAEHSKLRWTVTGSAGDGHYGDQPGLHAHSSARSCSMCTSELRVEAAPIETRPRSLCAGREM